MIMCADFLDALPRPLPPQPGQVQFFAHAKLVQLEDYTRHTRRLVDRIAHCKHVFPWEVYEQLRSLQTNLVDSETSPRTDHSFALVRWLQCVHVPAATFFLARAEWRDWRQAIWHALQYWAIQLLRARVAQVECPRWWMEQLIIDPCRRHWSRNFVRCAFPYLSDALLQDVFTNTWEHMAVLLLGQYDLMCAQIEDLLIDQLRHQSTDHTLTISLAYEKINVEEQHLRAGPLHRCFPVARFAPWYAAIREANTDVPNEYAAFDREWIGALREFQVPEVVLQHIVTSVKLIHAS